MDFEDAKLIERAQRYPNDFGLLYAKYRGKIFSYFLSRARHKQAAEDYTQETFLKAYEHLSGFRLKEGSSYASYLFTIAHNILINHYRAHELLPIEDADELTHDKNTTVTDRLETKIETEAVWDAAQELTESERAVFMMKYKRHLRVREIAHIVHKTENAVKLMLSRGRKKLTRNPSVRRVSRRTEPSHQLFLFRVTPFLRSRV